MPQDFRLKIDPIYLQDLREVIIKKSNQIGFWITFDNKLRDKYEYLSIWYKSKEYGGIGGYVMNNHEFIYIDSWKGKKKWVDKYLGPETDITITRDKGIVYGKVLVDDYPGYIERWLSWRDRGLVIMPANKDNINFSHPQVIRYDGSNLDIVKRAMKKARYRRKGEKINFLD